MFSVLYLETLPCRIASLNFNYSPNNESIECGIFLNDNRRDLSTRRTIEQLPGLSGTIASHRVKTGKLRYTRRDDNLSELEQCLDFLRR